MTRKMTYSHTHKPHNNHTEKQHTHTTHNHTTAHQHACHPNIRGVSKAEQAQTHPTKQMPTQEPGKNHTHTNSNPKAMGRTRTQIIKTLPTPDGPLGGTLQLTTGVAPATPGSNTRHTPEDELTVIEERGHL